MDAVVDCVGVVDLLSYSGCADSGCVDVVRCDVDCVGCGDWFICEFCIGCDVGYCVVGAGAGVVGYGVASTYDVDASVGGVAVGDVVSDSGGADACCIDGVADDVGCGY